MADTPQIHTRMTAAEFMALPESDERLELIHGEIVMSPSPKYQHQRSSINIIQIFGRWETGGELQAEIDLHIGDNVVRPDIFWVSDDNTRCYVGEDDYWHGVPDLIIEIVSPSTELRDRGDKFEIYEQAGVREYWLVDPVARYIEVYVHDSGRFSRHGIFGPDKPFNSPILNGQQVDVGAILEQKSV